MSKLLGRLLEEVRNQGISAQSLLDATQKRPGESGKEARVELAGLLAQAESRYRTTCQDAQQLDAAALLDKTLDLLQSASGDAVVRSLTARFRFLFIDEFQDTTATQAAIVAVTRARHMVHVRCASE